MPFVPYYEPNRAAASIADLLLRRGDIEANRATAIGNASANAALQSGNAWVGAITGIGQTIAGIPGQMQQQKAAAQTTELREAQLNDIRRTNKSRDVFEAALKNPTNYNEDGTVNDEAITNTLRQQDVGAWQQWQTISAANQKNALDLREKFANIQKTNLEVQDKQRQIGVASSDYLGRLAFTTEQVLGEKPDDPLHARDTALAAIARGAADGAIQPGAARQASLQLAQTSPDDIKNTLASMVPPELRAKLEKESAETAKARAESAKAGAEAENLKKFGRTTAGTPEEQYLVAVANGDTATAKTVLQSIHDLAQAKKDPAQQAMANELSGLRRDEAKARLDALREKNAPIDIEPDIQTTAAGRRYIDLSGYTGDARNRARSAANDAGAIGVSKEQANALQEIDNARLNQKAIVDQIGDLLPKGFAGRAGAAVTVPLEKLFQTNDQVAAFNSWRTAAIQTLRATAGSKGLRINQAEIGQAIENDIPKLTDTVGVAQQKVKNIETMLENAEKSILVRDRSAQDASQPIKVGAFTVRVK